MSNHDSTLGGKRQKLTPNNCGETTNFCTKNTITMNPSSSNGNIEREKTLTEDADLNLTKKRVEMEFPSAVYDDDDKYYVEIDDGFMKISMAQNSTLTTEVESKKSLNKITDSTKISAAENNKSGSSNNQNCGPDSRTKIPETVMQYQRQLRKTQAAKRASTPLPKSQLQIVYNDEHMVVVNKPSGVLTVPGINSNPSMLTLLYEVYKQELDPQMKPEHMIVHRLDMDTSGLVLFAKSKKSLLRLQALFRNRDEVSKYYEAVVCGHLRPEVKRGCIDLPLQRDHRFPPFMRVATPRSEREAQEVVKDLKKAGWKKIVKKKAKPSQTLFEVIGREYRHCDEGVDINGKGYQANESGMKGKRYPVTRLRLTLKTGRTHQLRVHCASIGHPILGDPAYGIYGEASSNGGFDDDLMDILVPSRATMNLQLALEQYVKDKGQVMCLHARELQLNHPETGKALIFEQPPSF